MVGIIQKRHAVEQLRTVFSLRLVLREGKYILKSLSSRFSSKYSSDHLYNDVVQVYYVLFHTFLPTQMSLKLFRTKSTAKNRWKELEILFIYFFILNGNVTSLHRMVMNWLYPVMHWWERYKKKKREEFLIRLLCKKKYILRVLKMLSLKELLLSINDHPYVCDSSCIIRQYKYIFRKKEEYGASQY